MFDTRGKKQLVLATIIPESKIIYTIVRPPRQLHLVAFNQHFAHLV